MGTNDGYVSNIAVISFYKDGSNHNKGRTRGFAISIIFLPLYQDKKVIMNSKLKLALSVALLFGVGTIVYYKFIKHQLTQDSLAKPISIELDQNV